MSIYRELTSDELKIAESLRIKDPVIKVEDEGLHILSGKCFYCDNPWKYELEIDIKDSVTLMLTGKSTEVYVCESCRKKGIPRVESDRMRIIGERKLE